MAFGFLRTGKKVTQFLCVLALAMASIVHVCLDARSVDAGAPVFAMATDDASHAGDAAGAGERCHSCSVVPGVVLAIVTRGDAPAAPIPPGSFLQVHSFLQPTDAPPPRA